MAKPARKRRKKAVLAKKTKKVAKGRTKAAEYISCLQELHELQDVLLSHLQKEIKALKAIKGGAKDFIGKPLDE